MPVNGRPRETWRATVGSSSSMSVGGIGVDRDNPVVHLSIRLDKDPRRGVRLDIDNEGAERLMAALKWRQRHIDTNKWTIEALSEELGIERYEIARAMVQLRQQGQLTEDTHDRFSETVSDAGKDILVSYLMLNAVLQIKTNEGTLG